MSLLFSLLVFGALYAVFAFVRLTPNCGSHCNTCTKSCILKEQNHEKR